MPGFMGKILWIDLSPQTFREEQFPEEFYKKYISGIDMAVYLLYKHNPIQKPVSGVRHASKAAPHRPSLAKNTIFIR